ncbi:MAG: TRAP transporter large permease [Oscillospiraceae bacterium]|nr:TRAP transporter large permease [Oscillospiraceae bacterium]
MGAGILFGVLFILLFLGVPIAICLGIAAAVTMAVTGNMQYLAAVPTRMFTQLDNTTLMAVPFFILAGNIMAEGGISDRLIGFFELLLKRLPGRLACISVVASGFFRAISGSNPATVAAIGGITAPRMIQKGYPPEKAAAIAASSGTLGVVIPPSIPMVTYAVTAGVSIISMFAAGWVPGIMLIVGLCIANAIMCKQYDSVDATKYPVKEYFIRFKDAFLALLMPVIILGGIYGGIFTPTESAAVACVYALIVSCFVFKELNLKQLYKIFKDSCISSAVVLFVVGMSAPFAWYMTSENIPTMISTAVMSTFSNKFVILLAMNLLLLFLGCFLETQSIILLVTPILLPMATALGVSPVALGLIIIVNTSIGMITPPMAVNLFVATGICKTTIGAVSKKIMPYLILEFGILLLYTYVPILLNIPIG